MNNYFLESNFVKISVLFHRFNIKCFFEICSARLLLARGREAMSVYVIYSITTIHFAQFLFW